MQDVTLEMNFNQEVISHKTLPHNMRHRANTTLNNQERVGSITFLLRITISGSAAV